MCLGLDIEHIISFCPHCPGQNSVIGPHLNLGEAGKCHLIVCFMEEEMGLVLS